MRGREGGRRGKEYRGAERRRGGGGGRGREGEGEWRGERIEGRKDKNE